MTNAPAPEPSSASPAPALQRSWDAPILDENTEQKPQPAPGVPTSLDGRRARLRPAPLPWAQNEAFDDGEGANSATSEANVQTAAATEREPRAVGTPVDDAGQAEYTTPPSGFSRDRDQDSHDHDDGHIHDTESSPADSPTPWSPAVTHRRTRPTRGWRAAVYAATGGLCNPGPSAAEAHEHDLVDLTRTALPGSHRIAVVSAKGGVGKTTTTACLGLTLAEHRGDRIVALDANPDAGTLADRLTGQSRVNVRDLLTNLDHIRSWADISRYTSLAGRLQVLASEQDPASGEAFHRDEYNAVIALLADYNNVLLTDCGTGLVHSAMDGVLAAADTLIIAGTPTLDGASRASKTMDWLIAHGHRRLVDNAVVALSCDRDSRDLDQRGIREHFRGRARAVVDIPADPHLALGGRIDITELRSNTRHAYLRLAAHVAEQFDPVPTSPQTELAATVGESFKNPRPGGLATHGFRSAEANRG